MSGETRRSYGYCAAVAAAAACAGSFIGACMGVAYELCMSADAWSDAGLADAGLVLLVSGVALIFALPFSLIVGAPMLLVAQRAVARQPLLSTIAFALTGMVLTFAWRGDDPGYSYIGPEISAVFGALVAGAHVLVFSHCQRQSWRRTLVHGIVATMATVAIGWAFLDEMSNRAVRKAFVAECRIGKPFLAAYA